MEEIRNSYKNLARKCQGKKDSYVEGRIILKWKWGVWVWTKFN
jgi:hypothetical protein